MNKFYILFQIYLTMIYLYILCLNNYNNTHSQVYDKIKETISPYNAKASAKIKIKIIPTKILSYYALALTPASPTIPIDNPAA